VSTWKCWPRVAQKEVQLRSQLHRTRLELFPTLTVGLGCILPSICTSKHVIYFFFVQGGILCHLPGKTQCADKCKFLSSPSAQMMHPIAVIRNICSTKSLAAQISSPAPSEWWYRCRGRLDRSSEGLWHRPSAPLRCRMFEDRGK